MTRLAGFATDQSAHDGSEREPLLTSPSWSAESLDDEECDVDCVEPASWSELAYSSFLWWASAGEKDESMIEEETQDHALLADLSDLAEDMVDEARYKDESESPGPDGARPAQDRQDARMQMALIAYFHRLTKTLFDVCSDIVQNEEQTSRADADQVPNLGRDEVRLMGLDGWNTADHDFVTSFFALWYDRDVTVDHMGIECCGVRVC